MVDQLTSALLLQRLQSISIAYTPSPELLLNLVPIRRPQNHLILLQINPYLLARLSLLKGIPQISFFYKGGKSFGL